MDGRASLSVVSADDAAVLSVVSAVDAAVCSVVDADDAAAMQAGFLFRFTLLLVSCSCS